MQQRPEPVFDLMPVPPDQANAFYRLYADVAVNGGVPPFQPGESPAGFLNRIVSVCELHLGIFSDGLLLGDCVLHHLNAGEACMEIGGALLPAAQGRGIMRAAFLKLHRIAKERFRVRHLIGRTAPDNDAAIRLVESMGYRPQGIQGGELVLVLDL